MQIIGSRVDVIPHPPCQDRLAANREEKATKKRRMKERIPDFLHSGWLPGLHGSCMDPACLESCCTCMHMHACMRASCPPSIPASHRVHLPCAEGQPGLNLNLRLMLSSSLTLAGRSTQGAPAPAGQTCRCRVHPFQSVSIIQQSRAASEERQE